MKKRIQVLHLMSNLSLKSGVASVVFNYCKNINRNNVQFSIIYFDDVVGETYINELKKMNVNIYKFNRKSFYFDWKKFCKANKGKYDILHNHQTFVSPILITSKKKLGVKKIISHAHVTKFSDTKLKSIRNMMLSYPSKYISDQLFACSYDAGIAIFGNSFNKKGKIICNAINLKKFRFNNIRRKEIRNQLNIKNEIVIGHVGNMTPQKNHMFLLKVFKEITNINSNTQLLLIGDGYLRQDIIKESRKLKIEKNVKFLGVKENVNDYMCAMDVFLFPSLFEGLGIVLIEAQACGLKCVYSNKVPFEADIYTNDNIKLSLDDSTKKWAHSVLKVKGRINSQDLIRKKGYDILLAGKELEKTYCSLLNMEDSCEI